MNAADTPEQIRGSVSRDLGNVAALLGRARAAAEHFEYALHLNERMGALPWLARTQRDYAHLLAEHGDPQRASELTTAARAIERDRLTDV
jgi:hypothetical protein